MTDIVVRMADDGSFTVSGEAGRIEEYCAKRLKIGLNAEFASANISYYTLSFEPFNLSRKIITENIYKNSSVTDGIYYSLGYIFCPIYDYMAISPEVSVQIDAYELDNDGNVKAIIKSGIFKLRFAESLMGEGVVLDTVRQDVKFKENVEKAVNEVLKTAAINGANIINSTVTSSKIDAGAVKTEQISDGAVTTDKLAVGSVSTNILSDESVSSDKIKNANVTTEKIAKGAVTTDKIAARNITSTCIADKAIVNAKLGDYSVSEAKIRPRAVTTEKVALKAITPNRLDRTYLTEHQSLAGYAKESWVESKNYVSDISMKADKTELPKNLSELKNDVAVSYVQQNLTDTQKQTACENIGAVREIDGKMLSSNDYTDEDKEKLKNALTSHQDISMKADKSELSNVAFTGSYESLTDIPAFSPVATTGSYESLTDVPVFSPVATTGSYESLTDVPAFSNVAFSGSYNDLTDVPHYECSFTEELKQNYDEAFNHSKENHAPVNAEENVINGAYLNGQKVEINDKNLNLSVIDYEVGCLVFAEV